MFVLVMLLLQISLVLRNAIGQETGKFFSIDFSACSPHQQYTMYKCDLSIIIAIIECPIKRNE